MTLKELTEMASEHAKQTLVGTKDQYLTQFTLLKPNGHIDICATPWGDPKEKREMVFAVCIQALKEGAVAYCWCTEAWFASSKFEGPANQQPPPLGPMPRERPDRREAIIVIAGDGKNHRFYAYEIVRDQSGACKELVADEEIKGFESWITDALDRAMALNALDKGKLKEKLKDFLP